MLRDVQKMRILIERNFFSSEYTNIYKAGEDMAIRVLNTVIKGFEQEVISMGIEVHLEKYTGAGSGAENWEAYFHEFNTQLKPYQKTVDLKKLRLTHLYKNYFGTKGKNIFSYMNQITTKTTSEHTKFISIDSPYYAKCRDAISLISGVSIDILQLKDQKLFEEKLDLLVKKQDIMEQEEKAFSENKFFISNEFEKKRLQYFLELQNEINHKIGLTQMLQFPQLLPSFIDSSIVKDRVLLKHIFIEGYHGTGKTTLAQQIAIYLSKENSFYIDTMGFDETIITQNDEKDLLRFLMSIQYLKGILILDRINSSAYAKLFARRCWKIADEIGLKIIFISTLEQHNTLKNLQTFTELFHEDDWEVMRKNNYYLEISSSQMAKRNRLNILKNIITNYSVCIKKEEVFSPNSRLLEYLDTEFNGMIYLVKLALDNQDVSSLEHLKVKKAKEMIVSQYKPLIESDNLELIYLSAFDIYYRVQEDIYDDLYSLEHPELRELFEQKHLYIVKDASFNKNIAIYFPNQLIPIQLAEFLDMKGKNRFNLFASRESTAYLDGLSKNNIMNILRYLILRKEVKYIDKLVNFILVPECFCVESQHKINLYELNLLVATFVKDEFTKTSEITFSQKNLSLLRRLKKVLFVDGNDEYMIFLMLQTNAHIVKDWIIMLSRVIKNYRSKKFKKKSDKNIQYQYTELLQYFLRRTLKIITYPKYAKNVTLTKKSLEEILSVIEKYSLEDIVSVEYSAISKLSLKPALDV